MESTPLANLEGSPLGEALGIGEAAEPATPTEPDSPGDQPRRRILLSAGARTVEVEGPDALDAMVYTAERMWALATASEEPKMWAGGMGFAAELAPPEPSGELPDDVDRGPRGDH